MTENDQLQNIYLYLYKRLTRPALKTWENWKCRDIKVILCFPLNIFAILTPHCSFLYNSNKLKRKLYCNERNSSTSMISKHRAHGGRIRSKSVDLSYVKGNLCIYKEQWVPPAKRKSVKRLQSGRNQQGIAVFFKTKQLRMNQTWCHCIADNVLSSSDWIENKIVELQNILNVSVT